MDRTKYVARCLSEMKLCRAPREHELVSDHAGAEVERDHEGERLVRAACEHAWLIRDERETDVSGQPERADRDDIPKERGEAMPDPALMGPSMHEPGGGRSENVAPEDFEDRQEGRRDSLQREVPAEEPCCETREADE